MNKKIYANADIINVVEELRALGHGAHEINEVVEGMIDGVYDLIDIADYIEAMEEGDDDEAFISACYLGLA